MVGYELLANAQRDLTPEFAAQQLKALSAQYYKSLIFNSQENEY